MNKLIICWDCKKKLTEGEEFLVYKVGKKDFIKCKKCHKKDNFLRNFQPCEVYSRIVGYIRPIEQWNKGKKSEWKDRKPFKNK